VQQRRALGHVHLLSSQEAGKTDAENFVAMHSRKGLSEEDDHILTMAAGALYGGGADSVRRACPTCVPKHNAIHAQTVSVIYALFIVLTIFPEVQKKAQKEVDRVIGAERLPVLRDRADLPYIDAVVKELLRWNSVLPAGIRSSGATSINTLRSYLLRPGLPHRLMEDDEYNGLFIPAGTTVIANVRSVPRKPARSHAVNDGAQLYAQR
jgi:hypothetical protein